MLTAVGAVTELVVMGKLTATASAGTVTLAGTLTAGESATSVTTAPPGGAAALNSSVPVVGLPPTTRNVSTPSPESDGPTGPALTAGGWLGVVPGVPETVAVASAVTVFVVTGNVALVAPAGTVTLAGTVTAPELSERVTTRPPAGATEFNSTLPCAAVPPVT